MTIPLASTILDLFDSHQRLRQGTLNLELHLGTPADIGLDSATAGLTGHDTTRALNNLLAKMQKWCKVAQSYPSWLDRQSYQAIHEQLYSLYTDQPDDDQKAFLEVTLPSFGIPVLYADALNGQIAKKFDYPPYMVDGYQKFA